jgi:predicted acetyltransferase
MPELIVPTMRLEAAWRQSHDERGPGTREDGFGLLPEDDGSSSAGFAAWLSRLAEQANSASHLGNDRVHCTYRWVIEGDQVIEVVTGKDRITSRCIARWHCGRT